MRPYIFGARKGIHIIDLQQTVKMYRKPMISWPTPLPRRKVICSPTKRQAQDVIKTEASAAACTVTNRWLGGTRW